MSENKELENKELKNEVKLYNDVITRSGTLDSQASDLELRSAMKDAFDYLLTTVHMKRDSENINKLIQIMEEMKSDTEPENQDNLNFFNLDHYIDVLRLLNP